jgi:hypothetical protein
MRGGADPDPFYLIPYEFQDDPFGLEMEQWFVSLRANRRISNSARTSGSDPESHARAMESRAALSRNKPALSLGGHKTSELLRERKREREQNLNMLLDGIKKLLDWRTHTDAVQRATGSCLAEGLRLGTCPECAAVVIGNSENSTHVCEEGGEAVHIRDKSFPSLRPLRYLHDLVNAPELAEILAEVDLDDLGIVSLSVREILGRPENLELRRRHLPKLDLSTNDTLVYFKLGEVDDNWWQATLAVDACLQHVSQCPPDLWPTTALDRGKAWAHKGQTDNWSPNGKRKYLVLPKTSQC